RSRPDRPHRAPPPAAGRRDRNHRRYGDGLGWRLRLVVGLPDEQRAPALAVGQGQNGRLVVARGREVEIDSHEPAMDVAVVRHRAAPSRGDQQVLGTVAVHVVPRDARPELAERLRPERLPGPVIERRIDVAATVQSGSAPDRDGPPSTTSFCCTGTGPPSTRILEPAPDVLGARPRSRTATRGALARFWNAAAGPSRRLTTKSSAPSPSRSAVAIPCEMASSPAKPHLAPASLNVRSPLLRKATLFVASFGNKASSRRHSSPVNVARIRSHVSASITSHRWPVVARTSSYPSRSTSRNRASHDQSDASIPA